MSTKILTKREVDILVTYALSVDMNRVLSLDIEKSRADSPAVIMQVMGANNLGNWILEANYASWEAENGTGGSLRTAYSYDPNYEVQDPIALIKLVGYYFFNCCFARSWYLSDQREFCNGMINFLVQEIPGYVEASWEPTDEGSPA